MAPPLIFRNLIERARDFHIVVDDVSITHLTFGKEYTAAVEAKQVAQQDAERGTCPPQKKHTAVVLWRRCFVAGYGFPGLLRLKNIM